MTRAGSVPPSVSKHPKLISTNGAFYASWLNRSGKSMPGKDENLTYSSEVAGWPPVRLGRSPLNNGIYIKRRPESAELRPQGLELII